MAEAPRCADRRAVRVDQGDRGGLAALERARAQLGDTAASRVEVAAAAAVEFETAVRLGRYPAPRTVHSWLVERVGETAEALLMRARLDMVAGRNDPARALLRPNPRRASGYRAALHPGGRSRMHSECL